jgi:outer membrane protein
MMDSADLLRSLRRALGCCSLAIATMAAPGQAVAAVTLDEYFDAALKRSEVVANQVELIRQAEERYEQARAGTLPSLNGVASRKWQDPVPAGAVANSLSPNRQSLVALTLTQPIFRGFREFAGLRQTQALIGAQHQDFFNARLQLFKSVAQNFYDVLALEQDLRNLEEQISQNGQRETELKSRVRIGRSRTSEILTVQSAISTLRAQTEQLGGQLRAAREAFAFLSGLDSTTPLRDVEVLPSSVEPLGDYLEQLKRRPDVKAGQQRLAAAEENVAIARGAKLPSVDLIGNYYLDRSGALQDVTWDIQLALTMPLYAGGGLQSKEREALSQRTQAELNVSQVSRQADQEVRTAYESVVFDRAQLEALATATDTARRNYETQTREYRLGLVTNLEVLQALTAFQENQRALDRARYSAKLNYVKLQAAAVRRPALPEDVP